MRRYKPQAFTLVELLVSMAIASAIALAMVALYRAGLGEFRHASGRIELTRRARIALLRVAPLLTTAIAPNAQVGAIYSPDIPPPPYDTDPFSPKAPTSNMVMFASPLDLMSAAPAQPDPRNPNYALYEIGRVAVAGSGPPYDIVLFKMKYPPGLTPPIDPVGDAQVDLSVTPRILARNVSNFEVKRVSTAAVWVQVTMASNLISDAVVRERMEERDAAPGKHFLNINMSTMVQIPYYVDTN